MRSCGEHPPLLHDNRLTLIWALRQLQAAKPRNSRIRGPHQEEWLRDADATRAARRGRSPLWKFRAQRAQAAFHRLESRGKESSPRPKGILIGHLANVPDVAE